MSIPTSAYKESKISWVATQQAAHRGLPQRWKLSRSTPQQTRSSSHRSAISGDRSSALNPRPAQPSVSPPDRPAGNPTARENTGADANSSGGTQAGLPQRLLGVDYGTSVTGLAVGSGGVCSALQVIPSPRTSRLSDVARQVLAVALQHGVEGLLVGIPVQPGGSIVKPHTDSPMGERCRNLAHTLALMGKEHGLPVYLYNEYSTTRAALSTMGYNWLDRSVRKDKKEVRAKKVDAESAAMLLRLYYGNPRLAVRVNPKAVIKRQPTAPPNE